MSRPYQLRAYMFSKSKCLTQSYSPEGLETKISNFQLLSEILHQSQQPPGVINLRLKARA